MPGEARHQTSARSGLRPPLVSISARRLRRLVSLASDSEATICSKKQFMKERLVAENYQRTATKKLKARRSRSVLTNEGEARVC